MPCFGLDSTYSSPYNAFMKSVYILLGYLFITAVPAIGLEEGTLHTFTSPEGETLNAVIRAYSEANGKIQIERDDGRLLWAEPTAFSEPDQEYIRQWIAVDQFMSVMDFKIKGESDEETTPEDATIIKYEITLSNNTEVPFKDLKVEYRAFIHIQGYEGREDSSRVDGGQLLIPEILPGQEVSTNTQPITLEVQTEQVREADGSGGATAYSKKTSEERMKGFWVKVYGPAIDGKPAVREWCHPPDTMDDFSWQDNIE